MYRTVVILVAGLALVMAPSVGAQGKQKDPVLQQYLQYEFDKLDTKLTQLNDRLTATASKLDQVDQKNTALDAAIRSLDQKNTALDAEMRNAENLAKSTETSVTTLRLSTQQDLFSLKTDLSQARQDLTILTEMVRKLSASAPVAAPAAAPVAAAPPKPADPPTAPAPALEGYITAVDADGITINLGSNAGLKPGVQFNVYKAADQRTTIGVAEVIQVTDGNNSRAKVIFMKPETQLEFSDSVRLK